MRGGCTKALYFGNAPTVGLYKRNSNLKLVRKNIVCGSLRKDNMKNEKAIKSPIEIFYKHPPSFLSTTLCHHFLSKLTIMSCGWIGDPSCLSYKFCVCEREICPLGGWGCTMGFHVKLGIASFFREIRRGENFNCKKNYMKSYFT
jgi:hypothetical protein